MVVSTRRLPLSSELQATSPATLSHISSFSALACALALSACQSRGARACPAKSMRRVSAQWGGGVWHLQASLPVLRAHIFLLVFLIVGVVNVVDAVGRLRLVVVVIVLASGGETRQFGDNRGCSWARGQTGLQCARRS